MVKRYDRSRTRLRFIRSLCPWCGRPMKVTKCGDHCNFVAPGVRAALYRFAKEHGRTWRHELRKLWEGGCSQVADPEYRRGLQEAESTIGPRRLQKVVL
jgi:hypothetical protein